MIPHDTQLQIGSLLFEGIDQIDLTGPFEVLSRIPNTTYRFTGGVTAGIDGALRLAAELRGNEVAQAIQLHVAYAPEPPFDSGTPETAPAAILDEARRSVRKITAQREQTAGRVAAKLGLSIPAVSRE